jgi:bifunctional enzyme CysN/CysC
MDLVDYDQAIFDAIVAEYTEFANSIGITEFTAIPISGFKGDNIAAHSDATSWYSGPTLMAHLEGVDLDQNRGATQEFPDARSVGEPT